MSSKSKMQKDDPTILTKSEAELFDQAVLNAYTSGLLHASLKTQAINRVKDGDEERNHPFGQPGSTQDRRQEEAYSAEHALIQQLSKQKKLAPDQAKKLEELMIEKLSLNTENEGKSEAVIKQAGERLAALNTKMAAIEDTTPKPMASMFKVIRKVEENGRQSPKINLKKIHLDF